MNKFDVRDFFESVAHHAGIFLKGFVRTLYGVAVAGLVGLAVYGFVMVPTEGGYIAVCDFIVSVGTMAIAVMSMYSLGANKKRGAKR